MTTDEVETDLVDLGEQNWMNSTRLRKVECSSDDGKKSSSKKKCSRRLLAMA